MNNGNRCCIDKVCTSIVSCNMKYTIEYSAEKDILLRELRDVGFEDIIEAIEEEKLLDDIDHFNQDKYPNQRIYIVQIKKKVYAIPYVLDEKRKAVFLKTIYPSRDLRKKYLT